MNKPRNKINQYTCEKCGGNIVTIDVDEGVTPMFLKCRATSGCTGSMASAMYRCPQFLVPGWEWYRPKKLPKGANREHVRMGGLLLRKRTTPIAPDLEKGKEALAALIQMIGLKADTKGAVELATARGMTGGQLVAIAMTTCVFMDVGLPLEEAFNAASTELKRRTVEAAWKYGIVIDDGDGYEEVERDAPGAED